MSAGGGGQGTGGETVVNPQLVPNPLPEARLEAPYSVQLGLSTGDDGVPFELAADTPLPNGLSLLSSGLIEGTAHEFGRFPLRILSDSGQGNELVTDVTLVVRRSSYLALSEFTSSSSTTSGLFLYDLEDRSQPRLTVEPTRHLASQFSSDGQQLLLTMKTMIAATKGLATRSVAQIETGGAAAPLFEDVRAKSACEWTPGSDGLLCAISSEADEFEVFHFRAGGSVVSQEWIALASAFFGFRENGRYFLTGKDGTLLSTAGQTGGLIKYLASDVGVINPAGDRAFGPKQQAPHLTLFDLESGAQGSLSGDWVIASESQRYADVTRYDPDKGIYREEVFYLEDVDNPRLVSFDEYASYDYGNVLTYRDFFRDDVRVRRRGGELQVDFFLAMGSNLVNVPGLVGEVEVYLLAPDDKTLFIETRDASATQSGESSRYYLARLGDSDVTSVEEIASGFAATPFFAPTSRSLLLSSPKDAPEVGEFRIFDTTSAAIPSAKLVELPVYWAAVTWSRDGSYLGLLGGNEAANQREFYVVDVFDDELQGDLIAFCPPSSEAEPRCPNSAEFQP